VTAWVEPHWPWGEQVRALTTTRDDGRSEGPFAQFNLATHVGDDPAAVAANRKHLDGLLGGLPMQWLEQVHGTDIVHASADPSRGVPVADGVWTDEPDMVLAVLTADCLPVVLVDADCRNLALVHAGWRGLVAGVLTAACETLPYRPRMAWIGPGIGPEAYEVGGEVLEAVARLPVPEEAVILPAADPGKGRLDLFALAQRLLEREGVSDVFCERHCTYGDRRFYSYRRDGQTGRMATLAWLRHRT